MTLASRLYDLVYYIISYFPTDRFVKVLTCSWKVMVAQQNSVECLCTPTPQRGRRVYCYVLNLPICKGRAAAVLLP